MNNLMYESNSVTLVFRISDQGGLSPGRTEPLPIYSMVAQHRSNISLLPVFQLVFHILSAQLFGSSSILMSSITICGSFPMAESSKLPQGV